MLIKEGVSSQTAVWTAHSSTPSSIETEAAPSRHCLCLPNASHGFREKNVSQLSGLRVYDPAEATEVPARFTTTKSPGGGRAAGLQIKGKRSKTNTCLHTSVTNSPRSPLPPSGGRMGLCSGMRPLLPAPNLPASTPDHIFREDYSERQPLTSGIPSAGLSLGQAGRGRGGTEEEARKEGVKKVLSPQAACLP